MSHSHLCNCWQIWYAVPGLGPCGLQTFPLWCIVSNSSTPFSFILTSVSSQVLQLWIRCHPSRRNAVSSTSRRSAVSSTLLAVWCYNIRVDIHCDFLVKLDKYLFRFCSIFIGHLSNVAYICNLLLIQPQVSRRHRLHTFSHKLRCGWENIWRKVVRINHSNNVSSNIFQNMLSGFTDDAANMAGVEWFKNTNNISIYFKTIHWKALGEHFATISWVL
jgi:hypothetical protein